jgi:hypothetical protein
MENVRIKKAPNTNPTWQAGCFRQFIHACHFFYFPKGGATMDLCAGLLYVVMMIIIWLDDAGFWKWLKNNLK